MSHIPNFEWISRTAFGRSMGEWMTQL